MKHSKKCETKKSMKKGERKEGLKSNWGVNLIKVHYMHVCKYHNENLSYNYFMLIKEQVDMEKKHKL
jgi:hypothetical protein